jgi:hypothetical protein
MRKVIRICGLSLFLITASQISSIAGGSSWRVSIEKMQLKSSSHAVVVLKALERGAFMQRCPKLLLELDYQPDYLRGSRKLDLDRADAALKSHQEALASLQMAYRRQAPIRFGEMAGGLIPKKSDSSWLALLIQFFSQLFKKEDPPLIDSSIPIECQFTAPGLALFKESSNQRVVYVLNNL